jgi:2-iminobutanoate/2-iminopropanoate deaminase
MPGPRKQEVRSEAAPRALGPYSQAVSVEGSTLLFLSGQIGVDPGTGEMAGGGVKAQAEMCLRNLISVVEGAGGDSRSVVKTTIYLTSMDDFGDVNEVYAGFFEEPFPARACVEVRGLPKGALVEIEGLAVL